MPNPARVMPPAVPSSYQDRRLRELEAIPYMDRTDQQQEAVDRLRPIVREQHVGSAAPWSPIVRGHDAGGPRDFLDGAPISCGTFLELQTLETVPYGDGEEVTRRLAAGEIVRYELTNTPKGRAIVFYGSIAGHTFTAPLQPHMRFRWPR